MPSSKVGQIAEHMARAFDFNESREEMRDYLVDSGLDQERLKNKGSEELKTLFTEFKIKESDQPISQAFTTNVASGSKEAYKRGYKDGRQDLMDNHVIFHGDDFDSGEDIIMEAYNQGYGDAKEKAQSANNGPYRHSTNSSKSNEDNSWTENRAFERMEDSDE